MNEPQEGISVNDVTAMGPSSKAVERERFDTPEALECGTEINQYEIRGFEMARLQPNGSWESIYRVNNRPHDRMRILADERWFNSRGTGTYQARALISAEFPREAERLVLEEDPPAEVELAMVEESIAEAEERPTATGTDGASLIVTGDSQLSPADVVEVVEEFHIPALVSTPTSD
jgi:hypothetical protein